MNKIYEFTLHPSGYDPDKPRFYVIGAGTLEDGIAIVEDMNKQFVAWFDNPDDNTTFKLRIPSVATPIYLWEGADISASGGPFGEQYGKELFESYWLHHERNEWEINE
tara:strand:+ start:226 stop:549 length:324 start_codon:yes stop_codon:yes gene_type:complete